MTNKFCDALLWAKLIAAAPDKNSLKYKDSRKHTHTHTHARTDAHTHAHTHRQTDRHTHTHTPAALSFEESVAALCLANSSLLGCRV